MIIDGRI